MLHVVGIQTPRPGGQRDLASDTWQHYPMITAGTYPPIYIDFGSNEPDMTLQREYSEDGYRGWRDYLKDGKPVTAPVDIETLPPGKYRLV